MIERIASMKKYICFICTVILSLSLAVPVMAGDIPEALSYEDDAKVFIGTLLNFTNSPVGNSSDEKDVTVLPTLKIKGEVEVGVDDTYECCYFVKTTPQKGAEYFFGWLSNTEVYAYEVKSRTDDKITLHVTDEFSERIQNYLDEGLYKQAETARVNVGRKITLSEYMETTRDIAEKVTFSLNGTAYDIDVEKFFQFSDNTLITDVKNTGFKRLGAEDWADDILYITITHRQDVLYDGFPQNTYACVSRFCEVDRCSQMMSRLPNCDFTMKWEDLSKLYEFLPYEVQKELYTKNESESVDVAPSIPKKTYTPWIFGGGAIGVTLLAILTYLIRRKKV